MDIQRACLITFSGEVQGVGFRYTTQGLISDLPLAGYVKNLSNGSVEVLFEGPEEQIEEGIRRICGHMKNHIQAYHRTWVEPKGERKDFRIEY